MPINNPPQGSGNLILVQTITTGSDTDTIDFQSLNLDTHNCYFFTAHIENGNTGTSLISLYANNDQVAANYARQYLNASGALITAAAAADAVIANALVNAKTIFYGYVMRAGSNGRMKAMSNQNQSTLDIYPFNIDWTGTANVTRLTFKSDRANGFKTGSKISLYRIT